MGKWGESIGRFFGQMAEVPDIARADVIVDLVPTTAEYATAGAVSVLQDSAAFNKGAPGDGLYGAPINYIPQSEGRSMEVSLLVLADGRLRVVTQDGESWSRDVSTVRAIDAHREAGFVVFASDGTGLAVSTQTPVQIPPSWSLHTSGGVTNTVSGWDKVLAPYGVACYW